MLVRIYLIWEVHKGGLHEDESRWSETTRTLDVHKIPSGTSDEDTACLIDKIEENYTETYSNQDYNYQFDKSLIYQGWIEHTDTLEEIYKEDLINQLNGD